MKIQIYKNILQELQINIGKYFLTNYPFIYQFIKLDNTKKDS